MSRSEQPKMSRVWAMPNNHTFRIKPVRELIERWFTGGLWLDPFALDSPFADRCVTNDLWPEANTNHHLESLEFLRLFDSGSVDGVLFDPPYSVRQLQECYNQVGRKVHQSDTQSSFYGDRKKEVARVVKPGGRVLCFGWNSGGVGKTNGFRLLEVLLVPHGGPHNDTVCTVEEKAE